MQNGSFEAPASLVGRLDRELDAAMSLQKGAGMSRSARRARSETLDKASRAVTQSLSEVARLCAHVALAGALGIMSARLVQLIASMG